MHVFVLLGVNTVKLNINLAALLFIGASTIASYVPSSVNALSINNGSFESGIDPGAFTTVNAGGTNINNWTISSNNVDYIGSFWAASDGLRSIDLNGNGAGTFETVFTVNSNDVGISQTIFFDLATNGNNSQKQLSVAVNGLNSTNYQITSISGNPGTVGNPWTTFSYIFIPTSAGSSTLTFTSLTPDTFGAALDNVRVLAAQPVPFEFSPLSLIGVGGILLVRSKISAQKKA
jgi:choice-of-anchor C domain-containing protein